MRPSSAFWLRFGSRLVLLLFLCLLPLLHAQASHERPSLEEQILKQVNRLRLAHGLPSLKENSRLHAAASQHCGLLVKNRALSHQFAGEPQLNARVSTAGVHWDSIGENVGLATFPDELEQGWEHSPPHLKNLLDARYTEVGIAVLESGERFYGVQDFARTTSDDPPDEFERRVGTLFNRERTQHHLTAVRVMSEPRIRSAMCGMARADRLDAGGLSVLGIGNRFVVFTAFEPEPLPKRVLEMTQGQGGDLHLGVCYAATQTYPGGTYWVGLSR